MFKIPCLRCLVKEINSENHCSKGASGHGQPALIGLREKFRGKFLTNLTL